MEIVYWGKEAKDVIMTGCSIGMEKNLKKYFL